MLTAILVLFLFDSFTALSVPGTVYATLAILKCISILAFLYSKDVSNR